MMPPEDVAGASFIVAVILFLIGVALWVASFIRFQRDQDLHPGPFLVLGFLGSSSIFLTFVALVVAVIAWIVAGLS